MRIVGDRILLWPLMCKDLGLTLRALAARRLLIVDDNSQMRFLVRALLQAMGAGRCQEAGSAEEALHLIGAGAVDLLIADLVMGQMSGVDLAREVRRRENTVNRCMAIIIMTGHADRDRVAQARDAGAHSVLAKPISAQSLALHVTRAMNDRRPFVEGGAFFGPDRRRASSLRFTGPCRRRAAPARWTPFDDRQTVEL